MTPRIVIHKDGTCTVSGVPYKTMRSLLTAAALHQHDAEHEYTARRAAELSEAEATGFGSVVRHNQTVEVQWFKTMGWFIDQLMDAVSDAITTHNRRYGGYVPSEPTLKQRLRERAKVYRWLKSFDSGKDS